MTNSIRKIKKDLLAYAKRCKNIHYTDSLLITFLITGMFFTMVNTLIPAPTTLDASIENQRQAISTSIKDIHQQVKTARKTNDKLLKNTNLELIQLMEQGDYVIKSPWDSWQYGTNYNYNNWSGTYKGRGDKSSKYIYEGVYTRRGNWKVRNAMNLAAGKGVSGNPITPGNEGIWSWKDANGSSLGGVTIEKDDSINSGTNGNRSWGLVDLRNLLEPTNEVEILAHISPKEVTKTPVSLTVTEPTVQAIEAPVVNPQVNTPIAPPNVELPGRPQLNIPGGPSLTVNPTITPLKVEKVGTINIVPAPVTPVDFLLRAVNWPNNKSTNVFGNGYNGNKYSGSLDGTEAVHKSKTISSANEFIMTWGVTNGLSHFKYLDVDVEAEDARVFKVDEGRATNGDTFIYDGGTIKLKKTKNAGIDVQGTHMGDIRTNNIYQMTAINKGNIIGVGSGSGSTEVTQHAAFAFNNFDGSSDSTRVHLINEKTSGIIELNAPTSAGMMLRPEVSNSNIVPRTDTQANYNSDVWTSARQGGLNMQMAENRGSITLKGRGSVGLTVVKNFNTLNNLNNVINGGLIKEPYKTIIPAGQLLASKSDKNKISGILNTKDGEINVQSDDSVGVGILNTIQSVVINGEINIGTVDPTSFGYANKTSGGDKGKVERATGVYTQVATRPVRGRVYSYTGGVETIVERYYDDHGFENTNKFQTGTYITSGNTTAPTYQGETVGTETVEVGGKITLGKYSQESYGLRNKTSTVITKDSAGNQSNYTTSGSITLMNGGEVIVGGKKNYGAVAEGDAYKREVKKGKNSYQERVDEIGRIDIAQGGKITVTGQESMGYVLLSGQGTNAGTIQVTGHDDNKVDLTNYKGSLGFYGVKGTFTNTGTIESSGKIAHAVVVKKTTAADMIFNHYGTIQVDSPTGARGNIAVYSDGDARVNFHNNSKVYVGDYSVGIHSADKDKFNATFKNLGTLNIKIGQESTFAYLDGDATTTLKEFFNNGASQVNLEDEMGKSSSLVYASNKAIADLNADYTITKGSNASTIALLASNQSTVSVASGKTLTTNTNVALAAVDGTGSGSTAQNNGTIVSTRTNGGGIGIYSKDNGSKGINAGTITMQGIKAVGMYGKNVTNLENQTNKLIELKEEESVGMYGEIDGSANSFTVDNAGKIKTNKMKSVGIYVKNDSTATDAVSKMSIENKEIEIAGGKESIGIYAPKSTISTVGKITMADTVTESVATYISEGAKISNTVDAEIDLGKSGSNIAYYVKDKDTSLGTGAHLGKFDGYGVGVYLEGASSSNIAKLESTSPELNFKQGAKTGNGIVGLYLKKDTDISAYNKKITVGDTVNKNYAIGIYAEAQGTSTTPYKINADITSGKKSVGVFADKDSSNNKSYIEYKGTMDLGEGATGFFVNGEVKLDNTAVGKATVNLAGGVVAYVTENSKFDGGKAVVNLTKAGVGVYGKKGSTVNVNNWTFNNNGNAAEEVRLEEGQAAITGNKPLKPKMVLTHVINGETYLDSGKIVNSVADGSIQAEQNIGLMAEGIKRPAISGITWKEAGYEIENYGTIDFSIAKKSTAIFAESARAKNDGVIKLGENSTGIYGIYKDGTRKYATGINNKLEVQTTANSKISLGNNSTGMYLVNAQKLDNLGGEIKSNAGATKNVGIYAINGATADTVYSSNKANFNVLTMNNKASITLGNGSVGIFSKGKETGTSERNAVTNTGNITVGKSLTGAPSVAIYSENTKLETNSNVTVGENGIAFYGKHSEITAKGTANFQNKGVLAYLENSNFTSYLGNLSATQNTMIYLKNSTANMDGLGTKVNMTVADNYTGAYVEGNSALTGVKTVDLGKNSNGLFLKNAIFTSEIEKIVSTKEGAKGLLAVNSNLTNNSKIELSGDSSIGIYSNADSTKNVTNNGELILSGKKTLGVFLKGGQTFENKANINIADSANLLEPTIGIYTAEGTSNIKHTSGTIEVGEKSIGIYSTTDSGVEMNGGKIHIKDQGIGIYKKNGTLAVKGELDIDAHTAIAKNSEPTGVYAEGGANIIDSASKITVGAKSYGFILNNENPSKENVYNSTNTGTVTLGNDSVFLYSSGKAKINNGRDISSSSDRLIAFYIKGNSAGKGDFTNNATIDFSNTKGSIGIYAPNGIATNKGKVFVGRTDDIDPMTGKIYNDVSKIVYGIGMAADNGGHIVNDGEIRVYGNKSIGMYGKGVGTIVENASNGKIYLDGSRATATDKIQSMTGVYVDEGATFINRGDIRTADAYAGRDGKVNDNVSGLAGVAVIGSTLENYGNIDIDANNSYGVVIRGKKDANGNVERYAVIKNYGNIRVRGVGTYGVSWKDISQDDLHALEDQINSRLTSDPKNQELRGAAGTDKDYEGVSITIKDGKPTFRRNGVPVPDSEVEKIEKIIGGSTTNLGISDIGFYIDTLGRTKPIDIDGASAPINSQLIIGTEYSEKTNKKEWLVTKNVLSPFLQQIQGRNFKLTSIAGSLTWIATPVLDNNGQITGIAMSKLPYTSFVKKTDNAWNFTDGLEQRYGVNALDSREKLLFNKLNGIGKNEQAILVQAYDEMMGHQYGNLQQRINATANLLDKEFNHLKRDWRNPTKQSNKIKTFGMRDEYKTDTAGIIDYRSNAYGVAYVHEDQKIKMGNSSGWYAGAVTNRFKFKDIGKSRENQTILKAGVFKTMSPKKDHNGALQWTIGADAFVGINDMKRRYLVVDEVFEAKSNYNSYGAALKTDLGYDIRMSERTHLRPYGSLKMEYGRFNSIREKNGQVRLEVQGNDYFSVKPEVGAEFRYVQPLAIRTNLTVGVKAAYENELGKVGNVNNKGRVRYTSADWFGIRGEKDDRKGNGKFDLNIGVDNTRFGVTVNAGYDTKGKNVRGGIGFRAIY